MKEVKSDLKIRFEDAIYGRLMAYAYAYHREYSGVGFCRREGKEIVVYDFVLLDVGSEAYTEFSGAKLVPLHERSDAGNMKVWIHKHPMGNGIPGQHNWSSTDRQTAEREPFASPPEVVHWSVSIVLTPRGWVGRLDNYDKQITAHLAVVQPDAFQEVEAIVKAKALLAPKVEAWTGPAKPSWGQTGHLLAARRSTPSFDYGRPPLPGAGQDWTYDVIDPEEEDDEYYNWQGAIDFLWDTFNESGDVLVKNVLADCGDDNQDLYPSLVEMVSSYSFDTRISDVLEGEGFTVPEAY